MPLDDGLSGPKKNLHSQRTLPYRLGPELLEKRGGLVVRLSEDARRSVVFFGRAEPPIGEAVYGGTGFLLGYESDGTYFPYLVTNRHVARTLEKESEFTLRVNLSAGGSDPIPIRGVTWAYHPDRDVDLAACFCYLPKGKYDHRFYGGPLVGVHEVMCGDPISIVGLFRLRSGRGKNLPVVHTGHIAAFPDPSERIPVTDEATGDVTKVEGYLVEAQTLDGLSGAPVFAQVPIGLRMPDTNTLATVYGFNVRLLGVYQGSFKGIPDKTLAKELSLKYGPTVPVGMGIVVPSERIEELMNHEDLVADREELKHLGVSRAAAVADSAFAGVEQSALPTTDENPDHQEDFSRLLDAAVPVNKSDR